MRYIFTLSTILATVLIYLSGWFFTGIMLKPVGAITKYAREYSRQSPGLRLKEGKSPDELQNLAQTINMMLDRIENSLKVQKDFVANASHELRTPLSILIGELDVALNKIRSEDEYRNILLSIRETVIRLNNISNNLLLLARTENELESLNKEPVFLDETAYQAWEEIQGRYPHRRFEIKISPDNDESAATIIGSSDLLKIAFQNLLENAVKYSPADSVITLGIERFENNVSFYVGDLGMGIDESETDKVFSAFYRSEKVADIPGSGLGLTLVNMISAKHSGKVNIQSKLGEGTTFSIIFRRVKT